MIQIPAFGETAVHDHRESERARVVLIEEADADAADAYRRLLENDGFACREEYEREGHRFMALEKGTEGVFLNYFSATRELSLATETDCRYFSYTDEVLPAVVTPTVTQVMLEDFGMSYVIRLSDGRFILLDGGREFEPDCDRLMECLRVQSKDGRPVIAAWILTHPHSDHFHCLIPFLDRYGDRVTVQRFFFHFPSMDNTEHYPKLTLRDKRFEDSSPYTNVPRMLERVRRTGAEVYTPRTGQRYRIGDALCQILASMDDTIHCSQDINAISQVIRMELGGQVILWTADASFGYARLPARYGTALKADLLQIPHHGFQSGDPAAEIEGYRLIAPRVCFLPVSRYNAFTAFSIHRDGTRYLMTDPHVEEILVGDPQRTISLPYTPPARAKEELKRLCRQGLDNNGARTWVFTELNTGCEEDFYFTLLNMTVRKAVVWIELFFEDHHRNLRDIRVEVGPCRMKRFSVIGDGVDGDAKYFNWMSLKELGVPETCPFAVRMISDVPIVVSHARRRETYRSTEQL